MNRRQGFGLLAGAVSLLVLVVALMPAGLVTLPVALMDAAGTSGQGGAQATGRAAISSPSGAEATGDTGVPPAMRQQFADIARAYAENARFPDYSKPLADTDWNLLHPRAFVPRAAALANVPGVSATIEIDRSIVDRGIALPVRVRMSAEPGAVAATGISVLLQQQGQRSAPVALSPAAPGPDTVFAGVLPVAVLRAVPEGEAAVVAEVSFANGERSRVIAMVKLYEPAARLVRLGEPRVEGADLLIPVQFEVRNPGQYRVSANLFDAVAGEPVSHLDTDFPLTAEDNVKFLKVHAVTLRARGAAGPYTLRDIDITRMPDEPGELSGHGTATPDTWVVRGYPLDAYSNAPYVDPDAKQRLEFLQKLAGNPYGPGEVRW